MWFHLYMESNKQNVLRRKIKTCSWVENRLTPVGVGVLGRRWRDWPKKKKIMDTDNSVVILGAGVVSGVGRGGGGYMGDKWWWTDTWLGWWTHSMVYRWCFVELCTWNLYNFVNHCYPNKFNENGKKKSMNHLGK